MKETKLLLILILTLVLIFGNPSLAKEKSFTLAEKLNIIDLSWTIAKNMDDPLQADALLDIAQLYIKIGEQPKCERVLSDILLLSPSISKVENQIKVLRGSASLYKKLGQDTKALNIIELAADEAFEGQRYGLMTDLALDFIKYGADAQAVQMVKDIGADIYARYTWGDEIKNQYHIDLGLLIDEYIKHGDSARVGELLSLYKDQEKKDNKLMEMIVSVTDTSGIKEATKKLRLLQTEKASYMGLAKLAVKFLSTHPENVELSMELFRQAFATVDRMEDGREKAGNLRELTEFYSQHIVWYSKKYPLEYLNVMKMIEDSITILNSLTGDSRYLVGSAMKAYIIAVDDYAYTHINSREASRFLVTKLYKMVTAMPDNYRNQISTLSFAKLFAEIAEYKKAKEFIDGVNTKYWNQYRFFEKIEGLANLAIGYGLNRKTEDMSELLKEAELLSLQVIEHEKEGTGFRTLDMIMIIIEAYTQCNQVDKALLYVEKLVENLNQEKYNLIFISLNDLATKLNSDGKSKKAIDALRQIDLNKTKYDLDSEILSTILKIVAKLNYQQRRETEKILTEAIKFVDDINGKHNCVFSETKWIFKNAVAGYYNINNEAACLKTFQRLDKNNRADIVIELVNSLIINFEENYDPEKKVMIEKMIEMVEPVI